MTNWFIGFYFVGLVLAAAFSLVLWFVAPFLIDERYETESETPTWMYIVYPFIWPLVLAYFLCKEIYLALKKKFARKPKLTSQS